MPTFDWFAAPELQNLSTRDARKLSASEVADLLAWFQISIPIAEHQMLDGIPLPTWRHAVLPLDIQQRVTQLRTDLDAVALDHWTAALVRIWLQQIGPQIARKSHWLLPLVGLLGGDSAAALIGSHLRGENYALRCKGEVGIAALIEIGTRGALLELAQISVKCRTRFRGEMARCAMLKLAEKEGLTPDQLQDRILPECGFDRHGMRTLPYGQKTFRVRLDEQLLPYLQTEDGKRLTSLPKPTAKDDPSECANSKGEWKTVRTQIQQSARWLSRRFENAMISGEAWSPGDFSKYFLLQPLAQHIVRRLLWIATNGDGQTPDLFRIAEDDSFADLADRQFELSAACRGIRPVHPLDIDDAGTRAAWQQVFADYSIVSPFPQLDRPTFLVPVDQRLSTVVDRFQVQKVETKALIFPLETRGWDRAGNGDGGMLEEHTRIFSNAGITACVSYTPGAFLGDLLGSPTQTIKSLVFRQHPATSPDPMPLGSVPPRVFSEAMRDISSLVPVN